MSEKTATDVILLGYYCPNKSNGKIGCMQGSWWWTFEQGYHLFTWCRCIQLSFASHEQISLTPASGRMHSPWLKHIGKLWLDLAVQIFLSCSERRQSRSSSAVAREDSPDLDSPAVARERSPDLDSPAVAIEDSPVLCRPDCPYDNDTA